MDSLIIICCCLLAFATAMPNMTSAQYDEWNAQAMARLSSAGQQAWMRMAAMERQMEMYYMALPQSTRTELESFYMMHVMMPMNNMRMGMGMNRTMTNMGK